MTYLSNEQIARAFSTHDFEATFDRISETATWNLVGGRDYSGKRVIVAACRESAEYLSDITTSLDDIRVIAAESTVVVDSRASYTEDDGSVSTVASCDIYDFEGELLKAITSYTVEL